MLVRPETTQELLSFPSHISVLNQQKHPLYTGRHSKQMLTEHLIEKGENKVISKDQECRERDTALKCFWKAKKKESCMSYLSLDFKQCIFPSHHTSSSRCLLQAKTQRHKLSVIVSHSPASADRKGECFFFFPLPASRPSLHPSVTPTPSWALSLSLPISTANFSCVVYRHVRAWLNCFRFPVPSVCFFFCPHSLLHIRYTRTQAW